MTVDRRRVSRCRLVRSAAALLCLLAALAPAAHAATRGPSTKEERDKAVQLTTMLESTPWSEEAPAARQWLMSFLSEAPDLTVKRCLSLFGAPSERTGIPAEVLDQQLFSGAAHNFQHADESPGSTGTFVAGLRGALAAYSAWRAHGGLDAVPRLDALVKIDKDGQLEAYVRERGRNCR
ncbi:MAG TPA: hypothetical protein VGS57_22305 [Thermoanaerobaculia bacterium]|jgi:hypothetical protein|nr:hypothetical protein [Thermoanaerobaculia bacterium]